MATIENTRKLKQPMPPQYKLALVGIIGIICMAITSILVVQKETRQEPAAQEFRFLQRCESGLTVEYRATRRLPLDEVCGLADYSQHDVEVVEK